MASIFKQTTKCFKLSIGDYSVIHVVHPLLAGRFEFRIPEKFYPGQFCVDPDFHHFLLVHKSPIYSCIILMNALKNFSPIKPGAIESLQFAAFQIELECRNMSLPGINVEHVKVNRLSQYSLIYEAPRQCKFYFPNLFVCLFVCLFV